MGGHAAGEVASQMAAATIQEVVSGADAKTTELEGLLRVAAQEANSRIYDTQLQNPEYAGMGSTLTVLSFKGGRYYIAQVGDSRAYLFRDGALDQLTRDHSLVWPLFENGLLTKEELPSHPQKNLITRSIGPHPQIEVDLEHGQAREGDVFLLCSDGLTDVVPDQTLQQVLSNSRLTPQEMCDELVAIANEAGGPDNITVVIVRLEARDPVDEEPGKQSALRA